MRHCITVDVDGELARGTFSREPTADDLEAFREVVRAVKAKALEEDARTVVVCQGCGKERDPGLRVMEPCACGERKRKRVPRITEIPPAVVDALASGMTGLA